MEAYLFRLGDERGRWWTISNQEHTVAGKIGESQKSVLRRFIAQHGTPTGLTRYRGVCRPSEAAATLAMLQREKNDTQTD